jgi:putative transposase
MGKGSPAKGVRINFCYAPVMPRRPRIHLDGVPLHLVQRGHNREPCFFDEQDNLAYLNWLGEALRREDCALHAYVLMTNHVHLLLTPTRAEAIPRIVAALGRRYVQHINRTYGRTGTLWDSRYKSSVVQAETYLLFCQRYIELNPVRAGMVADPAEYRWSSYRHNALGADDRLLSPHEVYLGLGAAPGERQGAYRALFANALEDAPLADLRLALNQNQPIGNQRFYAEIEATTGQRRELKKRGRPRKPKDDASGRDEEQGELPLARG